MTFYFLLISLFINTDRSHVWQCTSVLPALGRLRWEEHELEAGLDYIARPLTTNNTKNHKHMSKCTELVNSLAKPLTKVSFVNA